MRATTRRTTVAREHRAARRTARHALPSAAEALVDYRTSLTDPGNTRWHFFKEDQSWHALEGEAAALRHAARG